MNIERNEYEQIHIFYIIENLHLRISAKVGVEGIRTPLLI